MKKSSEATESRIVISTPNMKKLKVRIKGLTDVISHAWDYKMKWQMLVKQIHGDKCKLLSKRLPKCPVLDFAESLYWVHGKPDVLNYHLPTEINEDTSKYIAYVDMIRENNNLIFDEIANGTFGFPAGGIKAAAVGACRLVSNIDMVTAKRLFHVEGKDSKEFVTFENEDGTNCIPEMREDMVVVSNGSPDIRYRGTFKDWYAELYVTFNADRLDENTMMNLIALAGTGGIGEWRPTAKKTASGDFGRFEVDTKFGVHILGK
jgi:hypothetical protein